MERRCVLAAVLLAVMGVLQSLRLFIPLPPLVSLFIFGSIVNACLLIAAETTGLKGALFVAFFTPFYSFLQQSMPMPAIFLPVAIVTNLVYVIVYSYLFRKNRVVAVVTTVLARMSALSVMTFWALRVLALPQEQALVLQMLLSWPQVVTSAVGGYLAWLLLKRISAALKLNSSL